MVRDGYILLSQNLTPNHKINHRLKTGRFGQLRSLIKTRFGLFNLALLFRMGSIDGELDQALTAQL